LGRLIVSASPFGVLADHSSPVTRAMLQRTIVVESTSEFQKLKASLDRMSELLKDPKSPRAGLEEALSWADYYTAKLEGHPALKEMGKLDPSTRKQIRKQLLEREGWVLDVNKLDRVLNPGPGEDVPFPCVVRLNYHLKVLRVDLGNGLTGYHLSEVLKINAGRLEYFLDEPLAREHLKTPEDKARMAAKVMDAVQLYMKRGGMGYFVPK
jgi:hypothetical protein